MTRGRGRPSGQAEGWVVVAALFALLVAGCTSVPVDQTATSSTKPSSATAPVWGDRLTATVTYGEGEDRFDPPPKNYKPKVDAEQAFNALAKQVNPQSFGTDETPTVLLASYTNYVTGQHATLVTGTMDPVAAASADAASTPWWTRVPVWYIRYRHVPMMPAGAPAAPGQTLQPQKMEIQEMVIPVSAETGQVLMMEYVRADRTATSWAAATG